MKVVVWEGPRGSVGIKSDFLWGFGFPVMSRKIARKVFSSVWLLQAVKGPVRKANAW